TKMEIGPLLPPTSTARQPLPTRVSLPVHRRLPNLLEDSKIRWHTKILRYPHFLTLFTVTTSTTIPAYTLTTTDYMRLLIPWYYPAVGLVGKSPVIRPLIQNRL